MEKTETMTEQTSRRTINAACLVSPAQINQIQKSIQTAAGAAAAARPRLSDGRVPPGVKTLTKQYRSGGRVLSPLTAYNVCVCVRIVGVFHAELAELVNCRYLHVTNGSDRFFGVPRHVPPLHRSNSSESMIHLMPGRHTVSTHELRAQKAARWHTFFHQKFANARHEWRTLWKVVAGVPFGQPVADQQVTCDRHQSCFRRTASAYGQVHAPKSDASRALGPRN